MMGVKERAFASIADVSIEDLVPPDHFYQHLDSKLDLSFVCDLVMLHALLRTRRGAESFSTGCPVIWHPTTC